MISSIVAVAPKAGVPEVVMAVQRPVILIPSLVISVAHTVTLALNPRNGTIEDLL